MSPRVCIAAAVGLCCALLTATALASRAPTTRELGGIARVLHVPGDCLYVRVSTVDSHFAKLAFRVPPTRSCAPHVANGVTVVRRYTRRWHTVFAGSEIGCPLRGVPPAVARDLRVCP